MRISQESTCSDSSLIRMQALRTPTQVFSWEICEICRNTLFYRTSVIAASDSFRFSVCHFIKSDTPTKTKFCEFIKIFKNSFLQNTSRLLVLLFICEFWEVSQNISFKTGDSIYKLQNFNHQIQKHFIQKRQEAVRRRSCT